MPKIIVGLGDGTKYDANKNVQLLHINIENWWGDDLLWNFPETIVTEKLKKDLENNSFSGFAFANLKLTKDLYFSYNYHARTPFYVGQRRVENGWRFG